MADWLTILAGLALLLLAAEALVRGSVWCALALGVRPMTVGLTVVAFGTSAPELVVGISSALNGAPAIATGSVLGSNIANLGLILGLTALIRPIQQPAGSARFETRVLIGASALLIVPMLTTGALQTPHGVTLLAGLFLFVILLVRRERANRRTVTRPVTVARGPRQAALNVALILIGLVGFKFGGEMLVDGAVAVARSLGMSEGLIGLTIVALGTSLPELAASLVAARRGHPELALGNVLGSNIFNVGMVLGAASCVAPLPLTIGTDGSAVALGLLMVIATAAGLRYLGGIPRWLAALLLLAYVGYLTARIAVER